MIWAYSDNYSIFLLAAVFILLYGIYLYRFWKINQKIKVKKRRLVWKMVLRTLYFTLFLIAFAGPSIGTAMKEIKQEGKDIFLAIDLSRSMNAEDIKPSRLQRMKFELKNLVKNFSSDRLGIIIFSSEAFIQCPLTFDQNVIQLHLDGLNSDLVPNSGTDVAAPLKMAYNKFLTDESQEPKSKAIILISDGEDFGDGLEETIEQLNQSGIKVFSMGVGTGSGSTIPRGSGVVIDQETNRPAISRLSSDNLRRIANQTDGDYFELSDERQEIPQLIDAIAKLEGTVMASRTVEASSNKYFYFLLAGFVLAILDSILPVRTLSI
ncbi:Ca-activated chloride channel family protein [Cyclobacterium lianum]|uniref:Ca-activated chloride channel family protein n=1 Tax=Cyclobacterium lianum TaxID=388280 RepID=A0A1M7QFW3_9BACT|nr:VWA domain-containing protein [Cyclobacterium lianum]SHN29680.1 Ca-activated chloride channel family protein [Cyclobacterium lianum]